MNKSIEAGYTPESPQKNQEPMDPFFGPFLGLLRQSLAPGCSEFGMAISLFSLAVSIRAAHIIEIGRFKGLSTLALAAALRFVDIGWDEVAHNRQRPGFDYATFEGPRKRKLFSIDPFPMPEATELIARAGLTEYVEFVDAPAENCQFDGLADLILIDGDHLYEACRRDVQQYVPTYLRPGGYFILHDYFGWYEGTENGSPIKRVADEVATLGFERLLVDTGYMSFVVFRKPDPALGV